MRKIVFVFTIVLYIIMACNKAKPEVQDIYSEMATAIQTSNEKAFYTLLPLIPDIDSIVRIKGEKEDAYSLLGYACKYGKYSLVKQLIENKADIRLAAEDDIYVYDALYVAIENPDTAIVRLLLENGADPNAVYNENGLTPLALSAGLGEYEISRILIEKGANVNGAGYRGGESITYPLLRAVESNSAGIVKLMVNESVNTDIMDKTGNTPISLASLNNNKEILDILLENIKDRKWEEDENRLNEIWIGDYSLSLRYALADEKPEGDNSPVIIDYTLKIRPDSCFFSGAGHMTYFVDLCKPEGNDSVLYLMYPRPLEGNNLEIHLTIDTIATLFRQGEGFFIKSPVIQSPEPEIETISNTRVKLNKEEFHPKRE